MDWRFRIKRDAPDIVVSQRKDGDFWVHRRGDRWPYGKLEVSLEKAYWTAVGMQRLERHG